MAKRKKKNIQNCMISKNLSCELIESKSSPQYIYISTNDDIQTGAIVIWTSEEAFKLAYKLMSLASGM